MVLASSDEADLIVDPFAGSGTTLRVCQQLKRKCLGIELNPEYVEMIKQRLKKPCLGFDSIDSRMERVPKDLNDKKIREAYLSNHIKWFLGNHNGSVSNFMSTVKKMYGDEPSHSSDNELRQRSLFDS
ncbi:site-specific DNA-methyltransferase [Desulfonema magnum]|uniref:SAM-dependent DNA methylase n=1 Tax=Desulfonema magnum TaxID=45655 RepID=A0A975GN11_9BACT|nr:SAM-dependent DNA methylase [Desulfonema magnum]